MKNIFAIIFITSIQLLSQSAWLTDLPTNKEIFESLSDENPEIVTIKKVAESDVDEALKKLAAYYREKFSNSYFFDWKKFENKFDEYKNLYPTQIESHSLRKNLHLDLFPATANWKLPILALNGENISAYQLRHLARQHKMIDIAFMYHYEKDPRYVKYFIDQMLSLNVAFEENNYAQDGNGVFEYFRAGYRVLNWFLVHNIFLKSEHYSDANQFEFIRTMIYHGAVLRENTKDFNPGNHHTKGLVGLFIISTLLNEFEFSREWQNHAIEMLTEHLSKEVNDDGFQFERSIHYHIGDIDNYFYVYYLAKLNSVKLPDVYQSRFYSMFESLIKMALPNKMLPVQQDDTDAPWAEFNRLEETMKLGSILFDNPIFSYFAGDEISASKYWYFRDADLQKVNNKTERDRPTIGSEVLSETGYYIMRNGWAKDDAYMIISAGLSDTKPDHQHGDMLGVYAYANGNVILPNYQVRYFLDDFKFFKNSFTKNVALVDSIPHGQNWKGNSGGSGFGKWLKLPNPTILDWKSTKNYDYFAASHDAYNSIGVKYRREVIFVKAGYWIVIDNFQSEDLHSYQQIWQGHFDEEEERFFRTTFADGSGLDIIPLNNSNYRFTKDSFRGKGNLVVENTGKSNFNIVTMLYPFHDFDQRAILDESGAGSLGSLTLETNQTSINIEGDDQYYDLRITENGGNSLLLNYSEKNKSTQNDLLLKGIYYYNSSGKEIDKIDHR